MKNKIVLVPFPYDDLSGTKVRPAVCLTNEISPHRHIVLAFITSRVSPTPSKTDIVINLSDSDFGSTGLKVSSAIKLHRVITISKPMILRVLAELSATRQQDLDDKLRSIFNI